MEDDFIFVLLFYLIFRLFNYDLKSLIIILTNEKS